jgi:hypothetical protein
MCYWHEYLDMVYLYKCIISNSDRNISIKTPARETRNTKATNGILLEVAKCKTVSYQKQLLLQSCQCVEHTPLFDQRSQQNRVFFKILFNETL